MAFLDQDESSVHQRLIIVSGHKSISAVEEPGYKEMVRGFTKGPFFAAAPLQKERVEACHPHCDRGNDQAEGAGGRRGCEPHLRWLDVGKWAWHDGRYRLLDQQGLEARLCMSRRL